MKIKSLLLVIMISIVSITLLFACSNTPANISTGVPTVTTPTVAKAETPDNTSTPTVAIPAETHETTSTPDVTATPTTAPTETIKNVLTPTKTETTVTKANDKPKITDKELAMNLSPYVPITTFKIRPGLYVEDGVLMHEGKPYVKLGVNFFGALYGSFVNNKPEFEEVFSLMNQYGIEYCRINMGLFWPDDYQKMFANPEYYYIKMDEVIHSAEQHNIGLIGSLFWNTTGVSDSFDEPANAWGNENSKTRQFMKDYIEIVVNRYSESPAIWGYEYANEYNLLLDLPNAMATFPNSIVPSRKTRLTRDENDIYKTDWAMPMLSEFARLVRVNDPYDRMTTSGNGEPRPSQWSQYYNNTWGTDDYEQMVEMVEMHNPDPLDTVSVHTYDVLKRFEGVETYDKWIKCINNTANNMKKPLFIGEYHWDKGKVEPIIDAIVKYKVPISGVWSLGEVEWSLNRDPELKTYVLEYIQKANEKLAKG